MSNKIIITNGMTKDEIKKDFQRKNLCFDFSSRELIELKTNLDLFIEEYNDFLDDEYLYFLEVLQAKLQRFIIGARYHEENKIKYMILKIK